MYSPSVDEYVLRSMTSHEPVGGAGPEMRRLGVDHGVDHSSGGKEDRDFEDNHENREPVAFHEVSGYMFRNSCVDRL